MILDCRGRRLELGRRTLVMGIVNVTPDSFHPGSRVPRAEDAIARGKRLVAEGADLLDVGGESTRPGSEEVPAGEEIGRVAPVLRALAGETRVPLSVDTRKPDVARAAFDAGAHVLNDVNALRTEGMAEAAARAGAPVVLMHMRGEPKSMQRDAHYDDVVREVGDFLRERAAFAAAHGIPRERILLDPGLGFGKRTGAGIEDNVTLLANLPRLRDLGYPLVVGASRKTFLGNLLGGAPVEERLEASLAAACFAAMRGADVVRVHDVKETVRVLRVLDALRSQKP